MTACARGRDRYGLAAMTRYLIALLALLLPLPALAQGTVTSADPRATEAGREILRAGGRHTLTGRSFLLLRAIRPDAPDHAGD